MNYTYEILEINEEFKNMLVQFSSDGKEPLLVGTRMPYEGESLDDVMAMYAPLHIWAEQEKVVVAPAVGTKNSVSYQAPEQTVVEPTAEEKVRFERQVLLYQSDWTQLPDAPLTAEQKAAWSVYRQALRDITAQAGFPDSVVFPTAP